MCNYVYQGDSVDVSSVFQTFPVEMFHHRGYTAGVMISVVGVS